MQSLVQYGLYFEFKLSDTATGGITAFVPRPVKVYPGMADFCTVNLAPTEDMNEQRHYSLSAHWTNPVTGQPASSDFSDWEIFVPIAGGRLPDLIRDYANNPYMWFYEDTEPPRWPIGAVWINTVTWDANQKVGN